MILNREPSYSLRMKDGVKSLEKGWKQLRTVNVKCQGDSPQAGSAMSELLQESS